VIIKNEQLEGNLKLEGFHNLEKLECSNNKLTSLDISESKNLKEIKCKRNQLQSINFGSLRNIQTLNCRHNLLKKLEVRSLINLKELDCSSNQLSDISFFSQFPYPQKITSLNITNNNFNSYNNPKAKAMFSAEEEQENLHLTFLTPFVNLVYLDIGNYKWSSFSFSQQVQNINKFYGSLRPLQKMSKLKRLFIANTGIDSGLQYLSKSVEEFFITSGTD